jgi:hypothetical protein
MVIFFNIILCQGFQHNQSGFQKDSIKNTHFSDILSENDTDIVHAMPDNIEAYDVSLSLFLDVLSKAGTLAS